MTHEKGPKSKSTLATLSQVQFAKHPSIRHASSSSSSSFPSSPLSFNSLSPACWLPAPLERCSSARKHRSGTLEPEQPFELACAEGSSLGKQMIACGPKGSTLSHSRAHVLQRRISGSGFFPNSAMRPAAKLPHKSCLAPFRAAQGFRLMAQAFLAELALSTCMAYLAPHPLMKVQPCTLNLRDPKLGNL